VAVNPDGIAWPLCGRILDALPGGAVDAQAGCPASRFGPGFTDQPIAYTFGPRLRQAGGTEYDFHRAIDLAVDCGTPVYAVATAEVHDVRLGTATADPRVTLRHELSTAASTCEGGCYHTVYLHLAEIVVSEGDTVAPGQLLGYSGYSDVGALTDGLQPLYTSAVWDPTPTEVASNACALRPAGVFQHLHFELREAPFDDDSSNWLHDAVHPLSALPYDNDPADNGITLAIEAVDISVPAEPAVDVSVVMDEQSPLDFAKVWVEVVDTTTGAAIVQPGESVAATHALHDYYVDPPWLDLEQVNLSYTHKDSGAFPWSCSPGDGCFHDTCPHAGDHGATYDAEVHLVDGAIGLALDFNGVAIAPAAFNDGSDYRLDLSFHALAGSASGELCVTAQAEDVHGVQTSSAVRFAGGGVGLCVSPALHPGERLTLTAMGASPGEVVYFVFGPAPGAGPCPGPLGGLCLDVLSPSLLGSATADADGRATLERTIPAAVPNATPAHFQAAITRGPAGVDSVSSNRWTGTITLP